MSTFAAAFREIVGPVLRKRSRFAGLMVAMDEWSFVEAESYVIQLARQRGMSRLPADIFDQVDDWIGSQILATIDEFEPAVLAQREIAARVAADIARCEALWVTT